MRHLGSFLNLLVQECPLLLDHCSERYLIKGTFFFFKARWFKAWTLNFWTWVLIFLYLADCFPLSQRQHLPKTAAVALNTFRASFLESQCSDPLVSDLFSIFPQGERSFFFGADAFCVPPPWWTCHPLLSSM